MSAYPEPSIYSKITLNLPNKYLYKVINDRSFIIRRRTYQGQFFQHVGANGEILSQLQFPIREPKQFIIVSQCEVIILQTGYIEDYSQIILWNLQKKNCEVIHVSLMEGYSDMNIFYFNDSKIVCCYEKLKKNRIRLIFFRLSELGTGVPFHQYVCEEFSENYGSKCKTYPSDGIIRNVGIVKLNSISMVGFIQNDCILNAGQIRLHFYQLDLQKNTGQFKTIEFDASSKLNPEKIDFLQSRITDAFEIQPKLFYIQVQTYGDASKYKKWDKKSIQEKYHTFYYNFNQKEASFGKIQIDAAHRLQFFNRIRLVKNKKQKPPLKIITNFMWENSKKKPESLIPIYYIEPDGQKILMMTNRLKNNLQERLEWPNYRKDIMYKIIHNSDHRQSWQITIYHFPKEWQSCCYGLNMISVNWLTEIIPECQEDLLELVYKML